MIEQPLPVRMPVTDPGDGRFQSPWRLLFIVAASIFTVEAVLMISFHWWLPPLPHLIESVLDAVLLTVLLMPILYRFLFRPLVAHTAAAEHARFEAEQASRAKSEFLAAMSHELRTPLNGVIGMVDVLHQTSLKGYQVEMADLIRESAFSLLGIIDGILDFSKIEAGKLELESVPTPIAEVVEKACGMLSRMAEKKGEEFTLFVDPAIPEQVMGDALRLRQVLVNLVNNAIKFSSGQQRPGRVSVRAVLAEISAERAVVEFRVADNGIGMDEATLSRLFAPFSQADVSTTRRFGGTGLGLAICRRLVELMGGEIAVRSELGVGSTFTVRLPFVPVPAAPDSAGIPVWAAGLSCLVVGGPEGLADDLAAYLAHDGASVERARDLAAARALMPALAPGQWVWVIDAADTPPTQDELHAIAAAGPGHDVRFIVIGRGKRREPRLDAVPTVSVDGNVLTHRALLEAVAIATGRAEVESKAPQRGRGELEFSPPSREVARRQGRLVLVAEDNETNQKVILQQLGLFGYAADVADNGRAALERWHSGDYALLLTDLHMPGMDGYQLAAAIRAAETGTARTPIVALTANALKSEAEHCRAVGMDGYLSKPVRLEDLKAMLERWLPLAAEPLPTPEPASVPPASVAGPVDVGVLKSLVGDDPAVIQEFLADFRISAAKVAVALRAAYRDGQAAQAGSLAHKLKSSARSVGALALGELCAEMERAGQAGQAEALTALLPRFEAELSAVDSYLDSLRPGYPVYQARQSTVASPAENRPSGDLNRGDGN